MALAQGTDSNVVGYVNTQGENGATLLAPMFVACDGTGEARLEHITGNFEEWVDTLQILDDTLVTSTLYWWIDVDGLGKCVWSEDTLTDDSAVTIPRGAGVVISSAAATIQNAGEVATTGVVIECDPGASVLGNPIPVAIKLGSISFTGLEEWEDTLQLLDGTLVTSTLYWWVDVDGLGTPVWSEDTLADDSNVELAPGAGFVLSSANGSTVTFPSAL